MPPGHRAFRERNTDTLLQRAKQIGAACEHTLREIVATKQTPEQGYRACLGVLRLGKIHGEQKLEQVCQAAIRNQSFTYRAIQALMHNSLKSDQKEPPTHHNIRGASYYQNDKEGEQPC
jgi:hypothetical protein